MSSSLRVGRALSAIERVCAETETADDLLEGLSTALHRFVPHDASTWWGTDPATLLATAPSRVEGLDAGLCDTFWHLEFHEQDTALFADLARNEGVSAMRLALGDRPARSPRYRDFMRPQGYADELRGVFRSGDSTWGVVGLYRDGSHAAFDEDDLAVVREISRPVADALRAHVRTATPWLGQPSAPGLIVFDAQGHVLSANADALCWIREMWPPSGSLTEPESFAAFEDRARDIDIPTPIPSLLSRARAVADGRERVPARLRVRDRRGRWLVMHASALTGGDAAADGTVALVIEAAKSAEIAPIVIDAYSLTPREREVLGAIARGGSTAEIAAELFLSPHTVRDHVKTLFEKVGVSTRGELVARLFGEHYADRFHEPMVHID